MSRVIYGAIAGFCATMAMTAMMRMLDQQNERDDRYPLPPREITEALLPVEDKQTATLLSHFGFGALAGGVYGFLPRKVSGPLFGIVVWGASYLGWVPLMGILTPATRHPPSRNLLMIGVHFVWGLCLAGGTNELERASSSIFAAGRLADRRKGNPDGDRTHT